MATSARETLSFIQALTAEDAAELADATPEAIKAAFERVPDLGFDINRIQWDDVAFALKHRQRNRQLAPDIEFFEDYTRQQVSEALVRHGKPSDYMEGQNASPSMHDLFKISHDYQEVTYTGYIVHKVRSDWRVSVTGFVVAAISDRDALDLVMKYRNADEVTLDRASDGTVTLGVWWD